MLRLGKRQQSVSPALFGCLLVQHPSPVQPGCDSGQSQPSAEWQEILKQLYVLTPYIEPQQAGGVFFEVPAQRSRAWGLALAVLVRRWNLCAALAGDRATAELAAHLTSEGELCRVRSEREFVRVTAIGSLARLGLSEDAIERLDWFGFNTVYELQQLTGSQIENQFADKSKSQDARLLHRFSRAGTVEADRQPVGKYQFSALRTIDSRSTTERNWLCDEYVLLPEKWLTCAPVLQKAP